MLLTGLKAECSGYYTHTHTMLWLLISLILQALLQGGHGTEGSYLSQHKSFHVCIIQVTNTSVLKQVATSLVPRLLPMLSPLFGMGRSLGTRLVATTAR